MNDIVDLMQELKALIESLDLGLDIYIAKLPSDLELQHIFIEPGDIIPNAEGGRRLDNQTYHRGYNFFVRLVQATGQTKEQYNSLVDSRIDATFKLLNLFQSKEAINITNTTDLIVNSVNSVIAQSVFSIDNYNIIEFNITIFKLVDMFNLTNQ
jgi:hypothetical protein